MPLYRKTKRTLTEEEILLAIERVRTQCRLDELHNTKEAGKHLPNFHNPSLRSALDASGYTGEEAQVVIYYVASHGFDYCLDPTIEATHFDPNNPKAVNGMVTDSPPRDACHWTPEQLRSRLDALRGPR